MRMLLRDLKTPRKLLIGLLEGKNFGKLIVRVADESSNAG